MAQGPPWPRLGKARSVGAVTGPSAARGGTETPHGQEPASNAAPYRGCSPIAKFPLDLAGLLCEIPNEVLWFSSLLVTRCYNDSDGT